MNQPETKSKVRNHITIEDTSDYDVARVFRLDFYVQPPTGQIPLNDLYKIVMERLNVLKLVFKVARQNIGKPSTQCRMLLINELKEHNLNDYVRLILEAGFKGNSDDYKRMRKNDHLSHFVLKMALAFDEDKKRWFFQQEVRLFKWRLQSLDEDSIMAFKCTNNLPYDAIPETEQNEIQRYLDTCNFSTPSGSHTPHFKVPFKEVLNLIRKRRVFCCKGNAFVPLAKLPTLFVKAFQDILCGAFPFARQAASNLFNDERFRNIFQKLPKHVKTTHLKWDMWENIHSKDLDELSKDNFPLCMSVLHDSLRAKHHLQNGGRVQYTLFLKGVGVPLEETVIFFRNEFLKIMTQLDFRRKKYEYCIRHLYGKEGKRKDYSPHACKKILGADIGPQDNHGCPYKVMSASTLTTKLQECGVRVEDVEDIVRLSQMGRYQAACSLYFDITHGCNNETPTEHPNIYFSESIQQRKYDVRL